MTKRQLSTSNKTVAYKGAIAAIAGVSAYALIVMVYVIIRSSITIFSIMPAGERSGIFWANSISVAYSVAILSLLIALVSAGAGAIAAVTLKKALLYFNCQFSSSKALLISCVTSLILLGVMYLILYCLLKEKITFNYTQTFLFWFFIPAAIFFSAFIVGGNKLNWILREVHSTKAGYTGV